MKLRLTFLASIAVTMSLSSCLDDLFCVNGNGIAEVERRRVTSFTSIRNETSFDVIYKKADSTGLSIKAEQNILKYIETNVYDGCLEIETSPGSVCLDYNIKPVISISSPGLSGAFLAGSGEITADTLAGEIVTVTVSGSGNLSVKRITSDDSQIRLSGSGDLEIAEMLTRNADFTVSGSGNITVTGSSDTESLRISGSGNIQAGNFEVNTASVIISGSGNAYTNIEVYLYGLLSGSGNIYLTGDPEIDQKITGSGRIIKRK